MITARRLAVAGILLVVCGLTLAAVSMQYVPINMASAAAVEAEATQVNSIPLPATLSGVVMSADEPIEGAIVQIQGTPIQTESLEDGGFTFNGIEGTTPITLTAWSAGHYIGWTTVNPSAPDWTGGDDLNISLRPLASGDNSEYEWFEFEGVEGSASCGLCHREYEEWQADQHSRAAVNHRFLTMYTGTNMAGETVSCGIRQ